MTSPPRSAPGWIGAALALALILPSCGGAGEAAQQPATPAESEALPPPRDVAPFSYEALDGAPISLESLAGRLSVIGFITTYDTASQAQARMLAELLRQHTPRINVAVLVLEPGENRPLVEAFAASLGLPYPVALADAPTIAGQGPFAGLHHVPSVVILDRRGREVFRHIGLAPRAALQEVLRTIERAEGRGGS